MNLKEVVEEAKKLDDISKILDNNGYLCSIFTKIDAGKDIEQWNLGFYSEEQNEITAVEATDSLEIGVSDKPLNQDVTEKDIEKIEHSPEKVLDIAKNELEEVHDGTYKNILMSLKKNDEQQFWDVVFFTPQLAAVSVKIDTESNEVIECDKSNLVQMK